MKAKKKSSQNGIFLWIGAAVVVALLVVLGLSVSRVVNLQDVLQRSQAGGGLSCEEAADSWWSNCKSGCYGANPQYCISSCDSTYEGKIDKCSQNQGKNEDCYSVSQTPGGPKCTAGTAPFGTCGGFTTKSACLLSIGQTETPPPSGGGTPPPAGNTPTPPPASGGNQNGGGNNGGGSSGGSGNGSGSSGGQSSTATGCNPSSPAKVWSCFQNGVNGVGKGNCAYCLAQNGTGASGGSGTGGSGSCYTSCYSKTGNGSGCTYVCANNKSCWNGCAAEGKSCLTRCLSGTGTTTTHLECTSAGACTRVNGAGSNLCSTEGASCPVSVLTCTTDSNCGAGQVCDGGSCRLRGEVDACWGNLGTSGRCYDCNGDGTINILDFSCFAKHWLDTI